MTYKGLNVLDIRPSFEDVKDGRMDDFVYEGAAFGVATPWKTTSENRRRFQIPFVFGTRGEIKEFRSFVQTHGGRLSGFWVPTWRNEFRVTSDESSSSTSITFDYCGFTTKFNTSKNQYRHIAVLTWGKIEAYGITASVDNADGTETITITPGLTTALDASASVVCPLIFARFSDDKLEYDYLNDSTAVVTASFTELPKETVAGDAGTGPHAIVHTGSKPVFLYLMTRGGDTWRFTDWPVDIDDGSNTWTAADITHDEPELSMEILSDDIKIEVGTNDATHPFRDYTDRFFTQILTVWIYETDADSPSLPSSPFFKGEIGPVEFEDEGRITAKCLSIFKFHSEEFPSFIISRTDNFEVFDTNFGISDASWQVSGTVSAINDDPPYIEAAAFAAKQTAESDDDWFSLGKITIGDETRMCAGSASGGRLYLDAPFRNASVSDSVTALPGYTRRIDQREDKFSDLNGFHAFPYLPTDEPQFSALEAPSDTGGKK